MKRRDVECNHQIVIVLMMIGNEMVREGSAREVIVTLTSLCVMYSPVWRTLHID